MSWLLGCLPPREPERLDYFFTVLGKAIYIANAFESKCRQLLKFARFVNACDLPGNFDAAVKLTAAMKEKMLAGTLVEIKTAMPITPQDIELPERAKDARNFIAHEGGHIGHIWDAGEQEINEQLELLRQQVKALAEGDNVVSRWQYGIGEKESAPIGMCEFYPAAIEAWIFGGAASFDAGLLYYERWIAAQPSS